MQDGQGIIANGPRLRVRISMNSVHLERRHAHSQVLQPLHVQVKHPACGGAGGLASMPASAYASTLPQAADYVQIAAGVQSAHM